jgi:hypothetical protein
MSNPSDKYQYIEPKEEAESLLASIEEQLKTRFQEIRDEKYNPNTKGYDYEKILQSFFKNYLGGAFDFLIRVGVLDIELKIKSVLKSVENEFDVVAIYKDAVPKLVHHRLVPYDSVAFITEAKQTLTLPKLEEDLQKFEKLRTLQVADNRRRTFADKRVITVPRIHRPLRFLFYYEAEADMEKVRQLLECEHKDAWDICVVLKRNAVIVNTTLPFVKTVWFKDSPVWEGKYPLLKGMFFTCTSIEGDFVDSWLIFWNLFRSTVHEKNEK